MKQVLLQMDDLRHLIPFCNFNRKILRLIWSIPLINLETDGLIGQRFVIVFLAQMPQ